MEGLNVLSLFDGMSCGRLALDRLGIPVKHYFASEVCKHAIQISQKNYPEIFHIGDVKKVKNTSGLESQYIIMPECRIDLLIGGSPCQGFSFSGKQLNFEDPRSKLFFEFVRILKEIRLYNPQVKFLLENVKKKKAHQNVISKYLGVEPIEINSDIFSAQNRPRLYWTNIRVNPLPRAKEVGMESIMESDALPLQIKRQRSAEGRRIRKENIKNGVDYTPFSAREYVVKKSNKANCLTTANTKESMVVLKGHEDKIAIIEKGIPYEELIALNCTRHFTPLERERLQTLPDNYTEGVSDTQRIKMTGNGWTLDVICHLLKNLKINQSQQSAPNVEYSYTNTNNNIAITAGMQ